jgi:hypothetical protein
VSAKFNSVTGIQLATATDLYLTIHTDLAVGDNDFRLATGANNTNSLEETIQLDVVCRYCKRHLLTLLPDFRFVLQIKYHTAPAINTPLQQKAAWQSAMQLFVPACITEQQLRATIRHFKLK